MAKQPTGTITFLFTDIEGSTKRWEQYPGQMQVALQRHDTLLAKAIETNNGYVFKTVGDAFCAAFATTSDALQAALSAQRAVQGEDWGEVGPIKVRIALHTGSVQERDGDYFGQPLNRVARLLSCGHGGQTLISHATHELVRDHIPAGVELRDLGEHRLKDLFRPEHIFQMVAPNLEHDFPPLRTLDNRPNNLPLQPTPFIGREKEVADIQKMLSRDDVRLLTLTGPGGIGKTRLVLQTAAELIDSFADGAYFVNLAPIVGSELAVSAIAQTLGVRESGGQPLLDTLKEYLRDKQMLLVLDNFEQLLEVAPLVSQLVAAAAQLKVLVTSRSRLQVRGEKEYSVPPLSLPEPKNLPSLERLTQYEGLRLFIERATDTKPDFEVTNDNAPAVAEICARLDGLPLAIELAAARIKILPPHAILTRLQSRMKLLTGGAKDLPARQQTLRNTIEWSYELLDEGEKQLFRRLAVFVGGRTLEAIEVVCNADGDLEVDVLDGVQSLADKSLLRQEEGVGGETRFVMLETIHEYTREKLQESGEAEEMRRQHAEYFLALAEQAEPELTGPESAKWIALLEDEHDNMRAALWWATRSAAQAQKMGLRLASALGVFWFVRGHWSEGRKWLDEVLSRSADEATAERAKALQQAGVLAQEQTDYARAVELCEEGLSICRQIGFKPIMAALLNCLARISGHQGHYHQAIAFAEEGLALSRELENRKDIASMLSRLGLILANQGSTERAATLLTEGLAVAREAGMKGMIASLLVNLGEVAYIRKDYDTAYSLYGEALTIFRETKRKNGIAIALQSLGNVSYHQGNYEKAAALSKESLLLAKELGNKWTIIYCQIDLARLMCVQGHIERAICLFGAANALCEVIGGKLPPADQAEYDDSLFAAKAQLDEAAWQAAWAEGRAMSMEQAIAYALEES